MQSFIYVEKEKKMIVRMAEKKDIHMVTDLRMRYFDDVYEGVMTEGDRESLEEENLKHLEDALNRTLFIAVGLEDGIIVSSAYMTVITKAANMRFREGRYGEIYGVYTDPEYRCNGLAGRCIAMLLECARRERLSYIELEASPEGAGIYEKNGFVLNLSRKIRPSDKTVSMRRDNFRQADGENIW